MALTSPDGRAGYGEAIYVGTAESNWDRITGGRPDNSDRKQIVGNILGGFTAEGVDVKEGTTGGALAGNSFDGSAITGDNFADSWIDLEGSGWRVEDNSGVRQLGSEQPVGRHPDPRRRGRLGLRQHHQQQHP